MKSRLSRLLLPALALLLPVQTVYLAREVFVGGEKWQYGTIGIYGTDILALLLVAVFAWKLLPTVLRKILDARSAHHERGSSLSALGSTIKAHTSSVALALLVSWACVSVAWAVDPWLAAYSAAKLAIAAGIYVVARSVDDVTARFTVWALVAGAAIQSGLATWQFLYQMAPGSTFLGMSAHETWTAGTSVLKLEGGRFLRAYGTLPHPNMLGGLLAVALALLLANFESRMTDDERRSKSRMPLLLAPYSLLPLLLLGLLLTFSRAAWLGAILGIGVVLISQKTKIKNLTSFGIPFIATLVFVFILREQIFPRFDPGVIVAEGSASERAMSFMDAKRLIGGNIWTGVGAGNFTAGLVVTEQGTGRPIWSIQPVHDVFVLVWAELGLIGLVMFVSFTASVALRVVRRPGVFGFGLLALLPSLLVDHWLWSSHFGIFLLFLLAGSAVRPPYVRTHYTDT